MILDATTKTLEILLAGAVAVTEASVVVDYSELDATAGTLTPAEQDSATAGVAPVTILAAPAAAKQRVVDAISVYNRDSAPITFTIQLDVGGVKRLLRQQTLAVGGSALYTRGSGWG